MIESAPGAGSSLLGVLAFFLVSTSSAQGTRVNAPVVSGGFVGRYVVAADGSRVFYAGEQTTDGVIEVFDSPLDGSQISRPLSAPLAPGRSCYFGDSFRVSPDESRAIYLADQDTDEMLELYSVPTDGSRISTKLSGAMISQGDVQPGFQYTPDGARVVFKADADQDLFFALFSVVADGSQPRVQLHPHAFEFAISPDSTRVVFRSDGLYSVPVDGSAPAVSLSDPEVPFVDANFKITPDGQRVVFPGGDYIFDPFTGDDFFDRGLYSVPIDGSAAPIEIMPRLTDWFYSGGATFAITPDSQRVVALRLEDSQLYGTRVDGTAPVVHLNDFGVENHVESFRMAPAAILIAFTTRSGSQSALCRARVDGATPPAVLVAPPPPAYVSDLECDPFHHVVYAQVTSNLTAALYSIHFDGGSPPVELSGPMVPGGRVEGVGTWSSPGAYWMDPSGRHVVYRADQETDEVIELFRAPIAGGQPAVKISGPMPANGDVFSAQFVPGTLRLVYAADQETDFATELFESYYVTPPPTRGGPNANAPAPTGSATRTVP